MSVSTYGRWVTLLALCAGCQLESSFRPHTQVVVDIDADRSVRARALRVQLTIAGLGEQGSFDEAQVRVERTISVDSPSGPYWPLRSVLMPRGGDASRRFVVTATATSASEEFVASARVLSGYVRGEVRHLQLQLTRACIGVTCDTSSSCIEGVCAAAVRPAESLPLFVPGPEPHHESAGAEAMTDAGEPPRVPVDTDAGAREGIVSSELTDPCARDHGGCDALVSCNVLDGVVVCGVCPAGYDDVYGDGTECRDRNECSERNGGCAAEAVCTNTPGRFECRCKPGFHGDGFHCSEHVPCERPASCAPEAICDGDPGLRVCRCKPGYEGNGAVCNDIDECERKQDDCDRSPAACVNQPGGYRCLCPAGYRGDGRTDSGCKDVDECKTGADNCDDAPDACVNTEGGFKCFCPAGYRGNGQGSAGCVDIDECAAKSHDCAPNARCVNAAPGFQCLCPPGYSGEGHGAKGCVDIDECAQDHGGCDARSECVNTPGGAHCGACEKGFGLTGERECTACECYERGGDAACASAHSSLPPDDAADFSGSRTLPGYVLFGFAITLPDHARVTEFRAHKSGSARPKFAMALYTDNAGQPGQRVTRTRKTRFSGSSDELKLPAEGGGEGECLPAGTYWLIGYAEGTLPIGQDSGSASAPFATSVVVRAGAELPALWPGGEVSRAPLVSMYVTFDHP